MKPIRTTWEIGPDKFGRRVLLHREADTFEIVSEPANQRDDGGRIDSLTLDSIRKLAKIIDTET